MVRVFIIFGLVTVLAHPAGAQDDLTVPPGYGPTASPSENPAITAPPPAFANSSPQPRLVESQRTIEALWIPGIAIFGASYALTAAFGSFGSGDYSAWSYAPLIGPWVALTHAGVDSEYAGAISGGIAQLVGVTLLILGVALQRTVRIPVFPDEPRSAVVIFDGLSVSLRHF